MIKEEKQLLFQDLCARQPYKVKISVDDDNLFIPTLKYIDGIICHFYECAWTRYIDTIKPFLRQMSSMTEEEKNHYDSITYTEDETHFNGVWCKTVVDWLNAHYFDYRGLIEKSLALEAPEWMYDNKN